MENNYKSELDILVVLEHQLACHLWSDMFQMLEDTAVMIYHQVDFIVNNKNDFPVLYELASQIQQWKVQSKGSLDTYSSKVLSGYLYGRIKDSYSYEDLKRLSKYFIAIKDINKEAGIVLDEDWSVVLLSSWGVPKLDDSENKHKKEQNLPSEPIQTSNDEEKRTVVSIAKTNNELLLERFWNKLTCRSFDYQYFWRNKINSKQYNELKSLIKSCAFENKCGFEKRFGRAIALCIAEWYKREYNGNDGRSNAVKELNLSCNPKIIWTNSGLPDNFLYGQQNNRYLDSLYVLGGLPINYLIHKQFNKVFKEIQTVYKQKESDEVLQSNVFINNNTLQESTRTQWGSLHMYFDALMSDDYPFADEDREEEPFRTFISNLQEWNPMRKKFSIEWIVDGNQDVEIFRRRMRLYVTPEYNGERNKSISYGRMSRWGVTTKTQFFRLYALFNNMPPAEISDFITFHNTYDGYFVGRLNHNYFTFNHLPSGKIFKVTLYIEADGKVKDIYSFDVNPYLQLYETDKYSVLSSCKSDGQSYALLPYDTKVANIKENEYGGKYFAESGDPYKLIPINGSITFKDEDEEDVYMVSKDHDIGINVLPHHNDISYLENDLCTHHYFSSEEEHFEDKIAVLMSKNDLTFTLYEKDQKPCKISKEDVILEYKKSTDTYYHKWTDEDYPIGMIKIKASYGVLTAQTTVFSLCSPKISFIRDCEKCLIEFDKAIPLLEVPKGLKLIDDHTFKDDKNYRKEIDTFVFKIGAYEDYIDLPVYRAFTVVELYRDREFFQYGDIDSSHWITVPFLLKNHFSLRSVSNSGVVRQNLKNSTFNYLDFAFDDDESPEETFEDVGPISFSYTKELNAGQNNIIFASSSNIKDYHFYYWSMKEEDGPKEIQLTDFNGFIQLQLSDVETRHGMIFQSLMDNVCPKQYYAPIIHSSWGDARQQEKIREQCFIIAAYYKTPFRIFAPIYSYLKGTDSELVDLAVRYMFPIDTDNSAEDKFHEIMNSFLTKLNGNEMARMASRNIFVGGQSIDERLRTLIRFSHEMYFSWIFLNRKTWKEMPKRFVDNRYIPITINAHKNKPFISKMLTESFYKGDSEHQTLIKEYLRKSAERLFLMCDIRESSENHNSLINIVNAYWGHQNDKGYRFPAFNNSRWYGYDEAGNKIWNDHKDDLPEKAVCFMRPKPIRRTKIGIIGFTNLENAKRQGEEVRNVQYIISFLRKLYSDKDSFIQIEQFLIKNLYTYNAY
jgi:hypothetical protein